MIDRARAAENAIQQLCRATLARTSMTPAEVDVVLAHLAAAAAALPQVATQLGDILGHSKDEHVLEMDTLTETADPDLAIGTARLHLDAVREPASTCTDCSTPRTTRRPTSPQLRASGAHGRGCPARHVARPSAGGTPAAADGSR